MTEMKEVRITKEQYDCIESLRYNLRKKIRYIIEEILCNRKDISEDTVFFAYKDSTHYYLVYEADILPDENQKEKIFDVGRMIKDYEERGKLNAEV